MFAEGEITADVLNCSCHRTHNTQSVYSISKIPHISESLIPSLNPKSLHLKAEFLKTSFLGIPYPAWSVGKQFQFITRLTQPGSFYLDSNWKHCLLSAPFSGNKGKESFYETLKVLLSIIKKNPPRTTSLYKTFQQKHIETFGEKVGRKSPQRVFQEVLAEEQMPFPAQSG